MDQPITPTGPVEEQTVLAVAAITRDGEFFGYRTVRIPTYNYISDDDVWNELEEFLEAWDTLYQSISGFLGNFKRI